MTKPETLKDLMIAGDLTMGEARRLTFKVFNGSGVLVQDLIPYKITMPRLDDLPDHVISFVIKAMLEASIVNVMEDAPVMAEDLFDDDDVIGSPSCSEGTKDGDNLPPKDGEFNG